MNIPSFDMWVLTNEGFKADINDDKKNKTDDERSDEIQIEAPNEGNDITYIVSGNDVKIKEDSKTKDGNGTTIDTDVTTKEVNDKILKKDVKIAVEAINDIKERERAKEIYRLTGGDDTLIKKDIIEILDKNSKLIREKESNGIEVTKYSLKSDIETECEGFWGINGTGKYVYLDISKIENTYNVDIKKMYNITSVKTVGKGEYLLPLLYHDVYKQQVNGQEKYDEEQFSIGDNFILIEDDKPITINNKYHLELKSPNAVLTFKNNVIPEPEKNKYKKDDDTLEDIYKNAIASSFMRYAERQHKNRKNLYMCIFHVENDIPIGMLIINISNLKDVEITTNSKEQKVETNDDYTNRILETFKNLIYIDTTDTSSKKDFKYTVMLNNKKPKIKCNLHMSHLPDETNIDIKKIRKEKRQKRMEEKKNERNILSRENYIKNKKEV
jgi:hypothetical protein